MGSNTSAGRRMSDSRLDTDNDNLEDSDGERDRDIATILRYLIRSGQVRIVTADSEHLYQDDSDEELVTSHDPPSVDQNPDISRIKDSDINQSVLLCCGEKNGKSSIYRSEMQPLPYILKMREVGMNKHTNFSQGDKCQINQRVLPNKMSVVDHYRGKVFCGTFAREGEVFMTAGQDYCIRLYDTSDGNFKLMKTVEARDVGWSILDTAVSPDGRHFIYCSWSECIHICNVFGDHEIHEPLPLYPDERRFCIFAMRFSQDGREILGGANDECLYVYDREENQRTLKIRSHEDDVNSVAFADSASQILFSGGDDGLCKVWDRRTLCEAYPKPVGILAGHEDGITYIDPKGDGRHLVTNSKDQTIKLWDMRAFSPSSGVEVTRKAVASHNWDYRWQRVPTSLNRQRRRLIGDTSLMTYRGHSVLQTLIRCHFSPEATTGQRYIYTGCAQGRVVVYDLLTGKIKTILSGHKGCVRDVSWHPYRNEIISSSWDGAVGRWSYCGQSELDSDGEDIEFSLQIPESRCNRSSSPHGPRRSLRLAEQRKKQESETC